MLWPYWGLNKMADILQQDDVIKWKHCPRYWPFVRGIHRSRGALILSFICAWMSWVNNREAGDLRRGQHPCYISAPNRRRAITLTNNGQDLWRHIASLNLNHLINVYQYFTYPRNFDGKGYDKNIERHTADTIVSWPYPKQWVIVHTSDLMMIIRQSIYILSIITGEMGKLKTYSPIYCIMDNGENMLNLTHTLNKIYLTGIL